MISSEQPWRWSYFGPVLRCDSFKNSAWYSVYYMSFPLARANVSPSQECMSSRNSFGLLLVVVVFLLSCSFTSCRSRSVLTQRFQGLSPSIFTVFSLWSPLLSQSVLLILAALVSLSFGIWLLYSAIHAVFFWISPHWAAGWKVLSVNKLAPWTYTLLIPFSNRSQPSAACWTRETCWFICFFWVLTCLQREENSGNDNTS